MNKKKKLGPGEKIPLSFDEAARIMFTNPNRMEPLNFLVSLILGIPYKEVEGNIELVNPRQNNYQIGKKKTKCDIIVNFNTNTNKVGLIIEINIRDSLYETIMNRNLFYMNRLFTSKLKSGEDYEELEKVLLVNFNNFYTDNIRQDIFDYYYIQNKYGHILTEKQEILCINIEECFKLLYDNDMKFRNSYERDLFYLSCALETKKQKDFEYALSKIEIDKSVKEMIMEVSEDMNNQDELVSLFYDKDEEEQRIRNGIMKEIKRKAHADGITEGILQNKKEMIMNMYHKNKLSIENIALYTDTDISKVKEILGLKK